MSVRRREKIYDQPASNCWCHRPHMDGRLTGSTVGLQGHWVSNDRPDDAQRDQVNVIKQLGGQLPGWLAGTLKLPHDDVYIGLYYCCCNIHI